MINTSITTKYFLFSKTLTYPTTERQRMSCLGCKLLLSFSTSLRNIFFCFSLWLKHSKEKKVDWQGKWNCWSSFTTRHLFVTFSKTASYVLLFLNVVGRYYILSWFINMKQRNSFDNIYLLLRKAQKGFIFTFFFSFLVP